MSEPAATPNLPAVRKDVNILAGGRPQAIVPGDFAAVARFANVLHESGLAPESLDSPQKCAIIIMQGLEIGMPPMMALQRIAVIKGRPALWGDGALALVYARTVADFVEEKIEERDGVLTAVCRTRRKNYPNVVEQTFSVDDAIRADLWETEAMVYKTYWDKQAKERKTSKFATPNDSPWWKYPKRMLQMRARGLALRDAYPDVLMGLYLAEELQGGENREATPAIVSEAPDPSQEDSNGTTADAIEKADGPDAGRDRAGDGGGNAPPDGVAETAAQESEQVAESDALPPLENPEDTAASWIVAFTQAETAADLRDFEAQERIFDYIDAKVFSERTAAKVEEAYNRAMAGLPGEDEAPNPEAE